MEGEALEAIQLGANLQVLVSCIVVEDHMHGLPRWDLGFYGIEEADELLVSVALHVAADHVAIQHAQGGKQRCNATAFVVVGHDPQPHLLERQARLGAVERLDLALLVHREHDGVGRWIDIQLDHVSQLLGEPGIVGQLELAIAMRLETRGSPDAPHRTGADAGQRQSPAA